MSYSVHYDQHYWIWVPTPDLFDYPSMAQWTRTRLWYVEITAFKDPEHPEHPDQSDMTDRSPEFLIAPALNQGMTDSTTTVHSTSPLTSTTATETPTTVANPTSVIPTKTPEEDPTSGHDNLSAGAKAGIGIGCGVLVVSVVVVMVSAILRHRRKAQERQLTLFSGSAVNDKSRANIAGMIPACPSCGFAERNNPSPVYELDGSAPSPAKLPCSIPGSSNPRGNTPEPVEPPGSPAQPVKNQDLISPAGSPNTPASPNETTGKMGLPENKSDPIHPDDPDWKYNPVRGSYGGQSQRTE
ncbi:hypothetical protein QBC37DRAFT_380745 [Rhypophila decipiens]|uniref:Uncharacterized protein n=1 Tax=Rhypophila decipiens TaxID=261697 RepID=A0AAN7B1G5_9PEZI|nr:hypothetical protein QBC37DRAFT_380745 [Rhypophila decipiens]